MDIGYFIHNHNNSFDVVINNKMKALKENNFKYRTINGSTWLEFATDLMGYDKFTYKGKPVFKYQLFWSGVKSSEIIFKRNGFSYEIREKSKD